MAKTVVITQSNYIPWRGYFDMLQSADEVVLQRDADGIVDRVFGPGDTIGERAFLNREPYRFTAVVATHCVLLRIATAELLAKPLGMDAP